MHGEGTQATISCSRWSRLLITNESLGLLWIWIIILLGLLSQVFVVLSIVYIHAAAHPCSLWDADYCLHLCARWPRLWSFQKVCKSGKLFNNTRLWYCCMSQTCAWKVTKVYRYVRFMVWACMDPLFQIFKREIHVMQWFQMLIWACMDPSLHGAFQSSSENVWFAKRGCICLCNEGCQEGRQGEIIGHMSGPKGGRLLFNPLPNQLPLNWLVFWKGRSQASWILKWEWVVGRFLFVLMQSLAKKSLLTRSYKIGGCF